MATADAATAVRKLQSNQPLTDAEKKILGISVTPENAGISPITGPTWQQIADEKAAAETEAARIAGLPKAGKILRYKAGSKSGFVIPVFADGKGGEFDGDEVPGSGAGAEITGGDTVVINLLKSYGLEGIAATVAQIRKDNPEISSDDLLALLKTDSRYNSSYLARFAGNAELIKKGLPTLSDKDYLKAEKEYEKIFKAYETGGLANRAMYAKLIGNSMDAVDVTERLQIGYDRLKADPFAEEAFRKFYPSLSKGDIVSAMLDPEEMLPALKRKATAAEIGGSALAQGLKTSQASAESLAAFGINKTGAQAGYRYIAKNLPRGQFLAAISPEENVNYTQGLAEDITFRKNVEAEKKQESIVNKELGRFSGQSGTSGSRAFGTPTKGVI
jgi:hypothetical protein